MWVPAPWGGWTNNAESVYMLNGVLLQGFEWEVVDDGTLWNCLAARAEEFAKRGFTSIWLPPAYKGHAGSRGVGYGVYDLYDLGEFDQKGSIRTKYGTKDELIGCVKALQGAGLSVLADTVLNHRMGADAKETFRVVAVHQGNRLEADGDIHEGEFWTRFDFPGRKGRYSEFVWTFQHFTGVGTSEDGSKVFRNADKQFAGDVDRENGNFDYLMGADVDLSNEDVREELFRWGKWFVDTTHVDGFRLDAVKHMPAAFVRDFLNHMRTHFGDREMFAVSEYWGHDPKLLLAYAEQTEHSTMLFDVPLHQNFHDAARSGRTYDLAKIFDNTLVQANPELAVTFVDNHDTQPGQSLESWVDDWFKPHAYALTLLRRSGYPVVFAGDYDGGAIDTDHPMTSHRELLDQLLDIRERFNHGDQHDTFDHPNCVAWVRTGDADHPGCMVVVMSNGDAGTKHIDTGRPDETFVSVLADGKRPTIKTDGHGRAEFTCPPGTVSIWVSDANRTERWAGN